MFLCETVVSIVVKHLPVSSARRPGSRANCGISLNSIDSRSTIRAKGPAIKTGAMDFFGLLLVCDLTLGQYRAEADEA